MDFRSWILLCSAELLVWSWSDPLALTEIKCSEELCATCGQGAPERILWLCPAVLNKGSSEVVCDDTKVEVGDGEGVERGEVADLFPCRLAMLPLSGVSRIIFRHHTRQANSVTLRLSRSTTT